jgi:8-oxo-dGTP pyrophosphatase MutT (NUDIX family)
MERVKKVLAYVVREKAGRRELLVFTHAHFPEAGLQVPAGTVGKGENVVAAVQREVEEESGLRGLEAPVPLGVYDYFNADTGQINERQVFLIAAQDTLPDAWDWIETDGGKKSDAEGYLFCFRWADLAEDVDLAGGQGDFLYKIAPK